MIKHQKTSVSNSDAAFLGWQKTRSGEVFALYNITAASHPSYGSTVTDMTLNRLNLQIPKPSLFQEQEKKFRYSENRKVDFNKEHRS